MGDIMFNKIYVKTITFIKEEWKFLLFVSIILFLGFFHLPYYIYVGGGIIDISDRLEVDSNVKISGSYNLSYVKSLNATIPSYLLSYVFDWERESIDNSKIDEEDNVNDIWQRESLYLQEANDNAIISAFKEANIPVIINKELLKVLYLDKESETPLKIGDIIVSINDVKLKEYSEIQGILNGFNVNDKIKIKYIRNDKEYEGEITLKEMDNAKKIGIYLIKLYDYITPVKVNLKFKDSEGGPSGGFMTALSLYTKLTSDITENRVVVGTGTIDSNGNVIDSNLK